MLKYLLIIQTRSLSETKDARTARKQQLMEENQLFEEKEGLLYEPGIAVFLVSN